MSTTAVPNAAPPKSRAKLFILIAVAALVLIAGAGAGVYFFLMPKAGVAKPVKQEPPVFYALEPFTVNLAGSDGDDSRYAHIGLTLKVADAKTQAQLAEYLPELRSRILLLLSSKHASDLGTMDGKRTLAAEIKRAAEQPFAKGGEPARVDSVLLTDFVIQ
ncbi:flagellar basal body-associated protein FliL [Chitinasiproducens palmae]|uniref:Flagellar protein FliL n=1 Tax=Chitinasiproducens palmae TaxID=1770053 RepID=A0A1H2PLN6_9BURK|nr:flagellar basal body-associated protein FliL [Chitinasiproducens palmae]SDV46588.1 flagellar FliL protein [Chitinasiproducens palmae]